MPRTFHRLKGGKVALRKGQYNESHKGSCNGWSHHRSHQHGNLQQQVSPPHHPSGHLHDRWRAAAKNLRSWGPTKILLEHRTDLPKATQRPDIPLVLKGIRKLLPIKLALPREDHLEEAHKKKRTRYRKLVINCQKHNWKVKSTPIKVSWRGFLAQRRPWVHWHSQIEKRATKNIAI